MNHWILASSYSNKALVICNKKVFKIFYSKQNAGQNKISCSFSDLESILQVQPILKGVKYHVTKDGPDSNTVILEVLFVNPRNQKIIPFVRVEKQLSNSELNGIRILNVSQKRINSSFLFFSKK